MSQDEVTLLSADINIAASGDNTVIAAVAGKTITVYKMWFVAAGANNVIFKNGATAINAGVVTFTGSGSSLFFAFDGKAYLGTNAGNAFVVNTSTTAQLSGRVYYALR